MPNNPFDSVKIFRVEESDDVVYVEIPEEKRHLLKDYLDPWRRRSDDIETGMEMIHHMADGWIGKHGLSQSDLATIDPEIARYTKIRHVGESTG
ncbi:MAG: hypothetical protein OEY64_03750 [Nitrospinota bacterium]|nr:hypothetical protein [Nitrospinota bacterium]